MRLKITLAVIAVLGLVFAGSAAARAEESSQSVSEQGLRAYFGFVPSAVAQDPARSGGATSQHGAPAPGEHSYHLIVAIFNAATEERITNATVTASVHLHQPARGAPAKTLDPMKIGDTISYGNFFELPRGGVYRIRLSVAREGRPRPDVIDLTYDHHIHGQRPRH